MAAAEILYVEINTYPLRTKQTFINALLNQFLHTTIRKVLI